MGIDTFHGADCCGLIKSSTGPHIAIDNPINLFDPSDAGGTNVQISILFLVLMTVRPRCLTPVPSVAAHLRAECIPRFPTRVSRMETR